LPESLAQLRTTARTSAKKQAQNPQGSIRDMLKEYIRTGSADYFYDTLAEADAAENLLLWVDWREHDSDIVERCEIILHTGDLSAEVAYWEDKYTGNINAAEIHITYKGETHKIAYPNKNADRDTTITALNDILQPDYEIRFCKDSDGGDALAFLPLSVSEWTELESEFGTEKINALFAKISKGAKLFG
jgi:hypothetical protein